MNTIFDSMRESLEKSEGIEIRAFGSFVVMKYGGYKGRNPKTGEMADVPPKRLPFFKIRSVLQLFPPRFFDTDLEKDSRCRSSAKKMKRSEAENKDILREE